MDTRGLGIINKDFCKIGFGSVDFNVLKCEYVLEVGIFGKPNDIG